MQNFLNKYNIQYFYHFTDKSNLESIQKNGLFSLANIQEQNLNVVFGGNDWSHQADFKTGLNKYVRLAFNMNHPMEYRARQDNRIKNTIWLKIDTKIIFQEGVKFSNEVSIKSGTKIYDISDIQKDLDSETLFVPPFDWSSQKYKDANKSELLIPHHIPTSFIKGYING